MLADAATSFNGKLYIHGGGWDSLMVRQFPTSHPSMALAVLLSADATEAPGTGEFRVQLVDEDGNDTGVGAAGTIGIGLSPLASAGRKTAAPIAIPFTEINFEKAGTYEFRLFWNEQPLDPPVQFHVISAPPLTAFQVSPPPAASV